MAAQDNVDKIALSIFGSSGFFVDAGCNDYNEQNNTFDLERAGWSGIAIDAQIRYEAGFLLNRPATKFVHAAIVSDQHDKPTITLHGGGMTATCSGASDSTESFIAPAKTLQQIFDDQSITTVDFLSLDLEGFEHEAISGIDFSKMDIKVICAEHHGFVPNYKSYDYMESLGYKKFYTSNGDGGEGDIWHRWFAKTDLELNLDFLKEL